MKQHNTASPAATHGASGHAPSGHGGHDESGPPPPFNWFHGVLGTQDGVEPNLLWRTPDMPPPFAALLVNSGLLLFVLFRVGRKPVVDGLRDRRRRLSKNIEEATRMREQATRELEEYRQKLKNLDSEVQRVQSEMRAATEAERQRALADAAARRQRFEQDAQLLLEQELKAAREELSRQAVQVTVETATRLLAEQVTAQDDRRLCDAYLDRGVFGDLRAAPVSSRRRGQPS
jgi:F-type H+-transporting ATPase subunit b